MAVGRPHIQHLSASGMGRPDCDFCGHYIRRFYARLFALRGRTVPRGCICGLGGDSIGTSLGSASANFFSFSCEPVSFFAGTFVCAPQGSLVHGAADADLGEPSRRICGRNCFHGFVSRRGRVGYSARFWGMVTISGKTSKVKHCDCGVPRGGSVEPIRDADVLVSAKNRVFQVY